MPRHPGATPSRGPPQDPSPRKGGNHVTPCRKTTSFKTAGRKDPVTASSTAPESDLHQITITDRVIEPTVGSPHHIMLSSQEPLFRTKYRGNHRSSLEELRKHSSHPAFGSWIRLVHPPASSNAPPLGFYLVIGSEVEALGGPLLGYRRERLIITRSWTEPPLPYRVDLKWQWTMIGPYCVQKNWYFSQLTGYPTLDNRPYQIEGAVKQALSSSWQDLQQPHPFGPAPRRCPQQKTSKRNSPEATPQSPPTWKIGTSIPLTLSTLSRP